MIHNNISFDNIDIKILILDNDELFNNAYKTILDSYKYDVETCTRSDDALEKLKNSNYNILICNYLLYPYNANVLIDKIRSFDNDLYIILTTSQKDLVPPMETMHNLDIQAYYEKNSNTTQFLMTIESAVKSIKQFKKLKQANSLLEQQYLEFTDVLKNAVEAKDLYTKGHSDRVAEYSVKFGHVLNLPNEELEQLMLAGTFHDIGKIGIPDSILSKPEKLTDEEYEIIKKHPIIGQEIINSSYMLQDVLPYIRHHHERIDGNGYPDKLSGNEIPYLSKIIAVCDTYDALTSNRSYRKAMSTDKAITILQEIKGTQLDSFLVDKFVEMILADDNKSV